MGLLIQTGGAAAQFGAGLGAGIAGGVQTGMAQAREDELRQEELARQQADADQVIAVLGDSMDRKFENEAGKVPDTVSMRDRYGDETPGMSPVRSMLDGQMENPEDARIRKAQAHYEALLGSISNPEAAAMLAQSADQKLLSMRQGRAMTVLEKSLESSVASGRLSEDEARGYAEALQSGKDPISVLDAWQTDREHRLKIEKAGRLKQKKILSFGSMAESMAAKAEAEKTGQYGPWYSQQAELMQEFTDEQQARYEMDPEGYDAQAAEQIANSIRYAPNPWIAKQLREEKAAATMELKRNEALWRGANDRVVAAAKALQAAGSSLDPTALKAAQGEMEAATKNAEEVFAGGGSGQAAPVADPGVVDPATGGGDAEKSPEAKAVEYARRGASGQEAWDKAKTVEEVDAITAEKIAPALSVLGISIEPGDLADFGAKADEVVAAVQELRTTSPEAVDEIVGLIMASVQMGDSAREAIAEREAAKKAKADKRMSRRKEQHADMQAAEARDKDKRTAYQRSQDEKGRKANKKATNSRKSGTTQIPLPE